MKKGFWLIIILSIAFITASCTTDRSKNPRGYVRHCVRLLDRYGLYSDTDAWAFYKDSTLRASSSIKTYDQAHEIIEGIIQIAGGKHSFLKPPVRDTSSYIETAPVIDYFDGDILYARLPAHSGVIIKDSLYTHTVLSALKCHSKNMRGAIVDLRGNHGGNMYPMIAAVSPLIDDGTVLKFQSRNKKIKVMPVSLDFILRSQRISGKEKFKVPNSIPVAILTDEQTASSGEATLLCFRGMTNARTFGMPTAGYASSNVPFELSDGYTLVVTVGRDIARTGEIFCDDPIPPDILTDHPLRDAISWINNSY